MRRTALLVLFPSSALLVSSQSGALPLDFAGNVSGILGPFSATIFEEAGDLPSLTFGIGEPITGRLIWDDSVVDSDPAADNGLYLNALMLMRVEIARNAWEITGRTVQIIPEITDPIQVYGIASGDSLDTFVADRFAIDFNDPTDYITVDSLPNMGAMFQSMLLGGSFSLNLPEGGERTIEIEGSSFELNAATETYEDLIKAGVIDPAKVVRASLQNAASVSGLLLTTEAMIADKPEKGGGGGGIPDMGGMGGMPGMM